MDTKKAEHTFENLRYEIIRFLENRAVAYPHLAAAASRIKIEFEHVRLPDPNQRLGGCLDVGILGWRLRWLRLGQWQTLRLHLNALNRICVGFAPSTTGKSWAMNSWKTIAIVRQTSNVH